VDFAGIETRRDSGNGDNALAAISGEPAPTVTLGIVSEGIMFGPLRWASASAPNSEAIELPQSGSESDS
jgi:hypothetical protein